MGSITTGVGLVSGIDIASLIDGLIAVESQGKIRLQQRASNLQAQRTALLDINARLLNFKTSARSFRIDRIFESALASSSNDEILTASAEAGAQPGAFNFIVKQLVSTSQKISKGFATIDESPLGLDAISFEFGNGRLAKDRSIEDLNGGDGIDRGTIVITDRAGASGTIDLSDVTSVNEVLDRINASGAASVTASVVGDHIVVTDTSGGAGSLTVANGAGDSTATDLGIAGSIAGNTLTGSNIFYVGANTTLASLNDGNGVLILNNVPDFRLISNDGFNFDIDLGRINLDIDDDSLLADFNNGEGVTIDDDEEQPDIRFVGHDGETHDVDLTGVTTVAQLKSRVSAETSGEITIDVVDGDHLQVSFNAAGAGDAFVLGIGPNGTQTAEDLGILNEAGTSDITFDGEVIPYLVADPAATTLQDVVDRINNAVSTTGEPNDGKIVASIGATGLILTDSTVGGQFAVVDDAPFTTNPSAAADLGLADTTPVADVITGNRIIGTLDSVLTKSLNGGDGINGAMSITVTDRNNNSFTVATLDQYDTLSEMMQFLNDEAVANGVDVTFSFNGTGNGLLVTDTSGGTNNLTISDDGATALGIAADVAADQVIGANVQLKYVSNASRLSDLNYGKGIGNGVFRITDGLGDSADVNIGGSEKTLYDVIQEINSRGLAVLARVNDNGDGIVIEEDPSVLASQTPFVKIRIAAVSGTTAKDLNILGESDDIVGGFIDGSYEQVVDLEASDSLEDVVDKIKDANVGVAATIINTGGGATPLRLNLSSSISGQSGELVIDTGGVDIGLTTIARGADAKVFFGSTNPADGFLVTSSTNTLDDVIPDVSIDLHQTSDEAVSLTITRDVESITAAVQQFVTTFNDAIGRLNQYDFYDTESEARGILLGNSTVAQVRAAMYRVVNSKALNVSSSFQYLSQVGFAINSEGELTFNDDEFRQAYEADPDGLGQLFAAHKETTGGEETVVAGVTVVSTEKEFTSLGFGSLFDNLLDDLTDSIDGVVTKADDAFDQQIRLVNDRIAQFDLRLEDKRAGLERQFAGMEQALAQLQAQSQALNSFILSYQQNRSLFGGSS